MVNVMAMWWIVKGDVHFLFAIVQCHSQLYLVLVLFLFASCQKLKCLSMMIPRELIDCAGLISPLHTRISDSSFLNCPGFDIRMNSDFPLDEFDVSVWCSCFSSIRSVL